MYEVGNRREVNFSVSTASGELRNGGSSVYFSDAVKVLFRRWYVLLIGAMIMAGAGLAAIKVVPTNYQASGQVLLLPPSQPAPEGSPVNPYLALPSGLTFTASLIAGSVSTLDVQHAMDAAGYSSPYSVSVVPGSGPLLVISTEDTDPAAALATRDELISRIEAELLRIQEQEDVADSQVIVPRQFGVSDQAEVLAGSKVRALAIIAALGIVLTALVAFSVDRAAMRRNPVHDIADTSMTEDSLHSAVDEASVPESSYRPAAEAGWPVVRRDP